MKLFVTNLASSVMDEELREIFAEDSRQVTEVSVITERATGKSRGFAFVELPVAADALSAIQALNGRRLAGRAIAVREAPARPPQS